jgi:hypothetical protein
MCGLNSNIAHIERATFRITNVLIDDGAGATPTTYNTVAVEILPTVDGLLSGTVSNTDGSITDMITGNINYFTGVFSWSSANGNVAKVTFNSTVSLEENNINPVAKIEIDKIRFVAKDRQISAEWSIQLQQDMRALYNADSQAELCSIIGQQIILDVDRETIMTLIHSCSRFNDATHNMTFDKNPLTTVPGFTWGPKAWMENILPKLNTLSAAVYNDTNMAAANVIACNPMDAAILESLNGFVYTGSSDADGDVAYRKGEVAGGKWKVLVSSVVPQGKMPMLYKPTEEMRSVYIFAPYVPAVLTPYPLGNKPSLTVLSRYASQLIRPQGISVLTIVDTP